MIYGSLGWKQSQFAVEVVLEGKDGWYLNHRGTLGVDVHLFGSEEYARTEISKYLSKHPGEVRLIKVDIKSEVVHIQPAFVG